MRNDDATMSAWESVRAAQQGDRAAFGSIYRQYRDAVYVFVLSRTKVASTAEDLTSETFLRALRNIESVRYEGKDLRAWITTIARNVTIDYQRSARTGREVPSSQLVDDFRTVEGPEHLLLLRQLQLEVQSAIASLNPRQRECIFLRFYRGFSVQQTAMAMRSNVDAVRALQYRAIRELAAKVRQPADDAECAAPVRGAA